MDQHFKPVLKLMLFVMIMLWMFATCVGCSLKRDPAQQQKNTTSQTAPHRNIPPITVQQVDQDGDGTISATERQSLIGDQPQVIPTFATIIGLVLFASIMSAWASARWAPKAPGKQRSADPPSEHERE
jgi:hypothetical protein